MPGGERKRAEKCKHSGLRGERDVFLGNEVRCHWGKEEGAGRRRNLAYNEHTIIWGIRDSRWQDKSKQNAGTREAERMKNR